ncbi:hypothetical protein SAMN06264364_102194 [Quadrisphaera granulorum]|uniref:Ribonuclease VapC n=1 Tax=Quadrisphaera granulorum TaxID=317664 RepID=A0A316AEY1_9ACTN|nr:TA system VapC family ribonuclease toxin [Quadrisphaera granulorum]PWJ55828.1 hypothetical protein BXY45_102194 [Quadrisphaera granulorum]SZE95325.1 hypothetical protein SAMN06264364_102194 [Quadrisphaera granulorum]
MKLVDANVLLYAVNPAAEHHRAARQWLDEDSATQTVLLPWLSLVAFLRISTHRRLFNVPLSVEAATSVVEGWVGRANTVTPEPDSRHVHRMHELLTAAGSRGGNLVNDAHLAALALQWGATVVTFDRDFGRFPGVRWEIPGT